MNAILELRDVSFDERAPYECELRGVSLSLAPGDLWVVRAVEGQPITPLADVACGLVAPESGEVLFSGKPWSARSASDAASARGRIGRVFERSGWLSNLDIDENITLAQRYHMRRSPMEALDEARALARELGLDEIPAGRPAHADRIPLLKAQWVRALMGRPMLLLLERPVRDLSPANFTPLLQAISRLRDQDGVAVLWITDSHERLDDSALRPTRKCAMEQGALRNLE